MDTRPLERIAREIERHGIDVVHHDYDAVQAYGGGEDDDWRGLSWGLSRARAAVRSAPSLDEAGKE